MIDKIILFIPVVKDFDKLAYSLDWSSIKLSKTSGNAILIGALDNLYIRLPSVSNCFSPPCAFVYGSLAKYNNGNNFTCLSRKGIELSIQKLEDQLGQSLMDSKVYKIELGSNIILNNPVQDYIACLHKANYMERRLYKGTLYFQNNTRKMIFYDKSLECSAKNVPLPDYLKGKHILRYELKINKRLAKHYREDEISPYMLFNEHFYVRMIKEWHHSYERIQKFDFKDINLMDILKKNTGKKNYSQALSEYLTITGIKHIGFETLIISIDDLKIDISEKNRLKALLFDLLNRNDNSDESQLIQELSSKIKIHINHFR